MAEYQTVALAELRESPLNPRHHYGDLEELAESIRQHGVIQPLLVRPVDSGYEIAAGHRRSRAAAIAGLEHVPAIVRAMEDAQFLEVLTVENLQREDLHELEEAAGYRSLMDQLSYDVPQIAVKVGKSVSYVYQRLKLTDLTEEAQRAFWDKKITAGHAVLIARLQPRDQALALEEMEPPAWDPSDVPSVRALATWIKGNCHLYLANAPFATDDVSLDLSAGPCTTCPKLTSNNRDLFADLEEGMCSDGACYSRKMDAHVERKRAAEVVEQPAPALEKAPGPTAEDRARDKKEREDRKAERDRQAEQRRKQEEEWRKQQERQQAEEHRSREKRDADLARRRATFERTVAAVKWPLDRATINELVCLFLDNIDWTDEVFEACGLKKIEPNHAYRAEVEAIIAKASDDEVARVAVAAMLSDAGYGECPATDSTKLLADAMKRYGIGSAEVKKSPAVKKIAPKVLAKKKAPASKGSAKKIAGKGSKSKK